MKINRTYSIDHWIAVELQKKHNQSRFVNDAIKYQLDNTYQDISDASVKSLTIFLKNHPKCDPFIKQALENSLRTTYEHTRSN